VFYVSPWNAGLSPATRSIPGRKFREMISGGKELGAKVTLVPEQMVQILTTAFKDRFCDQFFLSAVNHESC
jgi:hypothetical protein